jgi:hypothetical protein
MSTVILDTITGKSTATTITIGSTPVVSSSANSMTIRGEGTAQTSIQQGLAKCWCNWNGIGTIAIRDSLNVTSITDNATADTSVTIANDMADTNYAPSSVGGFAENGGTGPAPAINKIQSSGNESAPTATSIRLCTSDLSGTAKDAKYDSIILHGDLA